jgi:hypothetical protein
MTQAWRTTSEQRGSREAQRLTELTGVPLDRTLVHATAGEGRRLVRRQIEAERRVSQISGFVLAWGEMLDHWIPFGVASGVARRVVVRRIRRRIGSAM